MLRNGPVFKISALVISLLLLSILPAGLIVGQGFPETATAGVRVRGFLIGWGDNSFRQGNVPLETDFISISAGGNHSLALHENGVVSAWGDNSKGQTNVPTGSLFTAVSAGGAHSLALKADGTIAAWGDNSQGQTDAPAGSNFVAVSAGGAHSLALKADGTIAAWGDNGKGQTSVPFGSFTAISAGGAHSLALRADGTIAAWGDNGKGQTNVPSGSFTAISAGGAHSLALRADGTIAAWGDNSKGQTNIPAGAIFTAISAGGSHSLGLKTNGTVAGWGDNSKEQVDAPNGPNYLAISAGGAHSLAIAVTAAAPKPKIKRRVVWNILAVADAGGSITPAGNISVANRGTQSFVITPDPGCTIKDVVVDGISAGPLPAYDFVDVVADHTIEAVFVADHTIIATAGTGGTIAPSGAVKVKDGADQSFTITAATGYAISDVKVDGVSKGALATYTFADVVADHTIRADFAQIRFTITASIVDGIGMITPPTQTVLPGGTASVLISAGQPGAGATAAEVGPEEAVNGILSVTDNGVDVTIPDPFFFTYTINNVRENHDIRVLFGPLQPI